MKYLDLVDISTIAYEAIHSVCGYKGKNLSQNRIGDYLSKDSEKEDLMIDIHQRLIGFMNPLKSSSSGVIIVFDSGKSKRYELYPEYKGNRGDNVFSATDFKKTLLAYRDFLTTNGIANISIDGVEADDIIAAISKHIFGKDMSVRINSRDSDLIQLLESNDIADVIYYNPLTATAYVSKNHKQNKKIDFEMAGIFDGFESTDETWAIRTEKVCQHRILLEKIISGDSTDNIKSAITYTKGSSQMGITKDRIKKVMDDSKLEIPKDFDWDFVNDKVLYHLNESVKTKKDPDIIQKNNNDYRLGFEKNKSLIKLDLSILSNEQLSQIIMFMETETSIFGRKIEALSSIESLNSKTIGWEEYNL